jgi:hypothetical protein
MLNAKNKIVGSNTEFLVSLAFSVVCIALFMLFPANNTAQSLTKNIFFLFILPVLYIKLVLGKKLSFFGFNLKNKKIGFFWGAIGVVFSLAISWYLFKYTDFRLGYRLPDYVVANFWLFLIYELLMVNFFSFVQSFFFQGFLLFTLEPKIGFWSVPIQSAVYVLIFLLAGSRFWIIAPFTIASFFGGIAALKSRSFTYSYFMSLLYIILLDALLIRYFF